MWTSFIGFMASGKSTLTRRLQATTNRPAGGVGRGEGGRAAGVGWGGV
jgi:hypothetical protein